MKMITNWDPFRELEAFQDRLASAFGRAPAKLTSGGGQEEVPSESWRPLVDIAENEKEFSITAELPQVKKEDVKVQVEDGVLTISGERKFEKEEKDQTFHRVERSYGSFVRSFGLADNVSGDQIKAEFKDGVLKLRLPKSEKSKPKAIDVKVG